jgi:hypothetical protein
MSNHVKASGCGGGLRLPSREGTEGEDSQVMKRLA